MIWDDTEKQKLIDGVLQICTFVGKSAEDKRKLIAAPIGGFVEELFPDFLNNIRNQFGDDGNKQKSIMKLRKKRKSDADATSSVAQPNDTIAASGNQVVVVVWPIAKVAVMNQVAGLSELVDLTEKSL